MGRANSYESSGSRRLSHLRTHLGRTVAAGVMRLEVMMLGDMMRHREIQGARAYPVDLRLADVDLGFLVDQEGRDRGVLACDIPDYGTLLHCMELEEHARLSLFDSEYFFGKK